MGGFSYTSNQVLQTLPLNQSMHCQPAYFNGGSTELIYVWAENDVLRTLQLKRSNSSLSTTTFTSSAAGPSGGCGADLSTSSNGTVSGSGILWASYASSGDAGNTVSPGILRAFDASNVNHELWNSNQNIADYVGNYAKFSSPTIADGHVYLATFSNQVVVYGLK